MVKKEFFSSKNKVKRNIIIGVSSIIIVTVSGTVCYKKVNPNDKEIKNSFLAGQKVQNIYAEQEIDETTIRRLDLCLSALGFGYSSENVSYFWMSDYSELNRRDSNNQGSLEKASNSEKLYIWCNDLQEKRPEYDTDPGTEPEITNGGVTSEYIATGTSKKIKCTFSYEYKGSKSSVTIEKTVTADTNETPDELKDTEEYKKFKAEFDDDYAAWKTQKERYDEWKKWQEDRNEWLELQKESGFFDEKEVGKLEEQEYRSFYVKLALKAYGSGNITEVGADTIKEASDLLYQQVIDENGNQRDTENMLLKAINGEEIPKYEHDGNEGSGGSEGDGSGGSGGSESGGSGGSSSGGSGGSGGSGSGGSGGEGSSEEVDKEGPEIKEVTITSPVSGYYSAGQKVQIKVAFDKNIYATESKTKIDKTTAPKFLIKFGEDGTNRGMTFESVSGSSIMYNYIIQKDDNGELTLGDGENYSGQVYNKSGYGTKITKINVLSGDKVIIADNQGPIVESIECVNDEGEYNTGTELELKVTFNENIYTARNKVPLMPDSVPVLLIYFGSGSAKKPVFDSYNEEEKAITYKYEITSEDRGQLKIDADKTFDGTKEIFDAFGNSSKVVEGIELEEDIVVNANSDQIDLNKKETTLDLNGTKTETLIATVNPEGTEISWESSNTEVATVDDNGKITALKIGEATITAKISEELKAECKVTVKDTTKGETKIELNKTEVALDLNGTKTEKLSATVTPTELNVKWSSDDEEIATVNETTGEITAKKVGETIVIAKAEDGTTTECKVVVTNTSKTEIEPISIKSDLIGATIDSSKTKEINLSYTIEPKDSNKNNKVKFESSDPKIATVDEDGKVKIVGEGTAVIVMTTQNGKKAYTIIKSIDASKDKTLANVLSGDYNIDTFVDDKDLLSMLRHVAAEKDEDISIKHQDWIVLDEKYYLLDVNKDGKVDTTDVVKVQRHIAATKSEDIQEKHKDEGWIITE